MKNIAELIKWLSKRGYMSYSIRSLGGAYVCVAGTISLKRNVVTILDPNEKIVYSAKLQAIKTICVVARESYANPDVTIE